MAVQIGSMYVGLTAEFSQFQRGMRTAESVVGASAGNMRRSIGLTERSVGQLQNTMNRGVKPYALLAAGRTFNSVESRANLLRGSVFALTAAFGGLAAAVTSNVVARYFDQFTGLENQIRVVSTGSADLAAQINAVAAAADRSRSSLSATATLYSRLVKAAPAESAVNMLRRVETISKALTLGGATAQESASAAIQFSQAIASNRLGGEEMRAILETPLGLELAKGVGVTIGQFREMGYAGKLTADVLFKALDKIRGAVDEKFSRSIMTIDQSLVIADNRITEFAGRLDDTYGVTRMLSTGILGFANNLDTLVPILASVGIGLGTAFAGRGLGGMIGRRTDAIRTEISRRKESLALAIEENKVAQRALAESQERARQANSIDQSKAAQFAPAALIKQAARAEEAFNKERKRGVELLNEQRVQTARAGSITAQTTVGAVRAAEKLSAEQIRLNGLQERAVALKRAERQANTQLTAAMGQQTQNTTKIRAIATAEKELVKIRRDQLSTAQAISSQSERITQRELQLANLRTEAERRAAREIAAARTKAAIAGVSARGSAAQQALLAREVMSARSSVNVAGMSNIAGGRLDASRDLISTQRAAIGAASGLTAAQRAMGGLAIATALGGRALGSFVGFLGGPWGVALTAAIGLMTVLGLRSAKTAQEMARARQIMSEELDKLGQGGEASMSPDAQVALISDKILQESERLRDVQKRMETIRTDIVTAASEALFRESGLVGTGHLMQAEAAWAKIAAQVRNGSIAVGEITGKLREMGISDAILSKIESEFVDLVREGRSAEIVIAAISKRINELDGKRAQIEVGLNLSGPQAIWDVLFGARPGLMEQFMKDEKTQRAQYGAGQRAQREQTQMIEGQRRLLAAAGEVNKVLNTPQKVRDREQQLLEQGLARTREEARKLATEELNLSEATRLAGQSASGAAKEYESFTNKIAELRERAAASGLSELDQEVTQFAERLKNGSAMMRDYIAAVNSGDLSKAPKELREVRDALLEIRANSAVDSILKQYGTGAQLAGKFAEQQEILNIAVASGKITADQASLAFADFVGQFGQYQWIDQMANAFTNFAETALTDFKNIRSAAADLLKEVGKIILQVTVLEPLKNSLRTGLGSLFGGGGGGGGAGGFLGGLLGGGKNFFPAAPGGVSLHTLHGGSRGPTMKRTYNPMALGSPSFHHSGLSPDEFHAVLQQGETILTKADTDRWSNTMSGLSKVAMGGGGGGSAPIFHIDAKGAEIGVEQKIQRALSNFAQSDEFKALAFAGAQDKSQKLWGKR